MGFRNTVARWLAPETFREAERHQYLRAKLGEVSMWCGYEFPEIDAAIHWAKASSANHFRAMGEPSTATVPGMPWIWSIQDFREHLRAQRLNAAPPMRSADAGDAISDGAANQHQRFLRGGGE